MDAVMATDDLGAAEAFLTHEAHLLDSGRYEAWLGLFTADATYWVPAKVDQADPHDHISLMYDDRRLLETRGRRLTAAIAHATTPGAVASRQVTNLALIERDTASLTVRSKFAMVEYRRNTQRVFAGTYIHRLVRAGAAFKIAAKRVN
ncbi:MAG: aromatic-ring-hydroxylating dioxygenase subunit beta, partial [Alphaproteobacteria bacterium]